MLYWLKEKIICHVSVKTYPSSKDVEVKITEEVIEIKGKFGTLTQKFNASTIVIEQIENNLKINLLVQSKTAKAYYGLMGALINNMVIE